MRRARKLQYIGIAVAVASLAIAGYLHCQAIKQGHPIYLPLSLQAKGGDVADYWVDSDVGGPGTGTFVDPWDDISTNINSLSAGDTMYLRGNAVPPAQLYSEAEIDITVSGAPGSPITIMPWNNEEVTIQTTGGARIFDWDADWLVIDDLDLDGNAYDAYAVRIKPGADNNIIRDCVIHETGSDGAIFINDGDDNIIDNCTISDTFKGNDEDSAGVIIIAGYDNIIQDCTIFDIRGSCITTDDVVDPGGGTIIRDNVLYTTLDNCSEAAVALKLGDPAAQTIVQRNVAYGFRYCDGTCGGSGGGLAVAMTAHNDADNVLFEDNEIYDCPTAFDIGTVSDIRLQRNVIHNLVSEGVAWLDTAVFINNSTRVQFYNNTIDVDSDYSIYLAGSLTDIEIKNNIFSNCSDVNDVAGDDTDYNDWFNCAQSISGANDITDDPDFVNAAGNDYNLNAASPCIDAGLDVGLPFLVTAPDMGAYEYEGAGGGGNGAGVVDVFIYWKDTYASQD